MALSVRALERPEAQEKAQEKEGEAMNIEATAKQIMSARKWISDDHQRLELAREAVADWRARKLSDCAAMVAVSFAIMPQPKPTETDIARAKAIIAAQPQRSDSSWVGKSECRFIEQQQRSDQPSGSGRTTDDSHANVHIEHFFPKGYDPDKEPWLAIRKFHNAALAAERKRAITWATAAGKEAAENIELKTQLLSALAAIERHNLRIRSTACYVIDLDLSSLREHDAEVRKPLVDALKVIKELTTTSERSFSKIYDLANDALAKVKP